MRNPNLFYRSAKIERSQVDEAKRSVDVSLSSEAPVRRYGEDEILLHTQDSVDLSRLNSALLNHDPNQIIGRIENARLDGKKTRATIFFDDDEDGERAFKKVRSGSLKGVSIGYAIEKMRVLDKGDEWQGFKGPAYIATRFSIYEGSLTPIPADPTVGVGRDCRSLDGIEIENKSISTHKEKHTMDEKDVQRIVQEALTAEREKTAEMVARVVRETIEDDNKPKMRIAPEKAQALLGRAGAVSPELKNEVADMIFEGRTEEEVQNKIFDSVTGKGDSARTDKGKDGDGTTIDGKDKRTIDQVDDEVFARSLSHMG